MGSIKINAQLKTKTEQATILTVALREALSILEMPICDLAPWLQEQIEQNPALQFDEEEGRALPYLDLIAAPPPSLHQHLLAQAREHDLSPAEMETFEEIVGNLDEKGFIGDLPVDDRVLTLLQTFDPPGIGAKNLQHSLLIQLEQRGEKETLAYRLIAEHYNDLLHHPKNLPCSPHELQEAITNSLSHLSLNPAAPFDTHSLHPQTPDIFIESTSSGWNITLNNAYLPRFTIDTSEEVSRFLPAAQWIDKMVTRRGEIIVSIVKIVLEVQNEFFLGKTSDLHPLSLRHLAEKLSLHESTISRAVKDKVVACPRGIYPLRFFFPHASSDSISHHTAKERLKTLIERENKEHPLTDEALAASLQLDGIPCARRTITKYRRFLKIPSASKRKKPTYITHI